MGRRSTRVPAPPPPPPPWEPAQVPATEHAAAGCRSGAAAEPIQAPATDKHPWNPAAAGYEFFPPTDWGMDPRPQGGFVSYLRNPSGFPLPQQLPNQQAMLQNAHYAGGPPHYTSFAVPQPSVVTGNPSPSLPKPSIPPTPSGPQQSINLESGEENGDCRTEKRLAWTSNEDERLVSSFFHAHVW